AGGASSRCPLRRGEAAALSPPRIPRRPKPLPPPDGEHRLLPAPHPRLPLRLDADPGRAGACAALRALPPPPPLPPGVDGGDDRLRPDRAGGERLSGLRAGDPQATA